MDVNENGFALSKIEQENIDLKKKLKELVEIVKDIKAQDTQNCINNKQFTRTNFCAQLSS